MAQRGPLVAQALVLGATGFIGGQITREAVARGMRVRAARRSPTSTGAIGDVGVEWVRADLQDPASLVAAMRGVEVVFHAAACYVHSVRGIAGHVERARAQMRRVLATASEAGVRRIVYTSTLTTIGRPPDPAAPADERWPYIPGSARDAYHELKWAMEEEALERAPGGLEVVALCPSAVFGPGDVHHSISGPLLAIARGRVGFTVSGVVNIVDVRDVAAAEVEAATRGRDRQRYILSGHDMELGRLISLAASVSGVAPPRWRLPPWILDAAGLLSALLPGDPAAYARSRRLLGPLSNAKAAAELGLVPRPIEETLRDAIAWFRARGELPPARDVAGLTGPGTSLV